MNRQRSSEGKPAHRNAVLALALTTAVLLVAITPAAAQLAGQGTCGATETKAPSEVRDNEAGRKALLQSVICLINAERTSRNLVPLRIDGVLVAAASGHSREAVRLKWWTGGADPHVNPKTGSTIESRLSGFCRPSKPILVREITYTWWGDQASPDGAVNWWMNISKGGHREAILDPGLRSFGVAVKPDVADGGLKPGPGDKMGTYVFDFGTCP
jgi:uncharacterized protein YkwD